MNIRILGAHARETASARCASILVDGVLALDAGALTSTLSIPQQRDLEAVLLTHVHYDHIRDVPFLTLNTSRECSTLQLYATEEVCLAIQEHLLNGVLYPRFDGPVTARHPVKYNLVQPYVDKAVGCYAISPVPMKHVGGAVGYLVANGEGRSFFYSGDTGSFPGDCWNEASPDLIIAEVTFPNRLEKLATAYCHLTPRLLEEELARFFRKKRYLPRIVAVHMDPALEHEICKDLATASLNLGIQVAMAREGMDIQI